jgi:hypothetical protein
MDRQVIPIRASSMSTLFDCPHRWEAVHILGMKSKAGAPAHLGTSIHAGTAEFDGARVRGQEASVDAAAEAFVQTFKQDEDVDWRSSDIGQREAERIGLLLTAKYCNDISPKFEYVSVELETKPFDVLVDGVIIRLTGTLDRARANIGKSGVGISDVKTGRMAVDQDTGQARVKGHAPQVGIYELLYEHSLDVKVTEPANIIGLQTTSSPKVSAGIGVISNARQQLIGDQDSPGLLEYAAMYIKQGKFPPNPKSQLCSEKYCVRHATCKYKE